jgi:hypothetical protein
VKSVPVPSAPSGPPSFVIAGATGSSVQGQRPDGRAEVRLQPRWDRINSSDVIGRARKIYFTYIERCPSGLEPLGIVLAGAGLSQGRVVFELPVLLPDEQYVSLELVRGRSQRLRSTRTPYRG